MQRLTRRTDPPCPKCGCQASIALSAVLRWGRLIDRRRCEHCGKIWTPPATPTGESLPDPDPGPVVYHVLRCPRCGSRETRVTSTRRKIRWHKCADCGHAFKSVEVDRPPTNENHHGDTENTETE